MEFAPTISLNNPLTAPQGRSTLVYMQKDFRTPEAAEEYRRNQERLDPVSYYQGRWPVGKTIECSDGNCIVVLREPSYQGD